MYLNSPALYERDYEPDGFQWLDCHQEERLIYAFERRSEKQRIAAVFNFSDEKQEGYELRVEDAECLALLFSSEMEQYVRCEGNAVLTLPPYSGRYYLVDPDEKSGKRTEETAYNSPAGDRMLRDLAGEFYVVSFMKWIRL